MAKKTESNWDLMAKFAQRLKDEVEYDSGIHVRSGSDFGNKAYITVTFDDRFQWDDDVLELHTRIEDDSELKRWIIRLQKVADKYGWEFKCRTSAFYDSDTISDGAYGDCLAKLMLTADCSDSKDEYFEGRKRSISKWRKLCKESSGKAVKLTCNITVYANNIKDALEKMDMKLLNADAAITLDENPSPDVIDEYEQWDAENDGDVEFTIWDDNAGAYIDVKNV